MIRRLLEALPGWGAIKVSPFDASAAAESPDGSQPSILSDRTILSSPGSDTALYLEAGAAGVLWLRCVREAVANAAEICLRRLGGLPGVVVEGNAFARTAHSHRVVVLARAGLSEIKPSARALLPRADWLVLNRDASATGEQSGAAAEGLLRVGAGRRWMVVDAASATHPGTAGLLDEIRAWARPRS